MLLCYLICMQPRKQSLLDIRQSIELIDSEMERHFDFDLTSLIHLATRIGERVEDHAGCLTMSGSGYKILY